MTRVEELLLECMTVRRWCVVVVAGAVTFAGLGYVAGREHVKAQVREAVQTTMTKTATELEAWGKRYSDEVRAKQQRERGK